MPFEILPFQTEKVSQSINMTSFFRDNLQPHHILWEMLCITWYFRRTVLPLPCSDKLFCSLVLLACLYVTNTCKRHKNTMTINQQSCTNHIFEDFRYTPVHTRESGSCSVSLSVGLLSSMLLALTHEPFPPRLPSGLIQCFFWGNMAWWPGPTCGQGLASRFQCNSVALDFPSVPVSLWATVSRSW